MLRIYKLEPLTAGDKSFVWQTREETYNLMGVCVFEKYDKEAITKLIINKGIKQFKRLRSKLVYRFFDWWWEEISPEEVIKEVLVLDEKKVLFKTKEDLVKYCIEELAIRFDLTKEMPYKLIFINNDKSETDMKYILIIKFDHTLTDGLGFMSLMNGLADNYSIDLYPKGMYKPISLLQSLMAFSMILYYAIYPVYRNLFGLKSGQTPWKTDKPLTGIPLIALSPKFELAEITKLSKNMGITFNDFIMSTFSAAIKKYCKFNYHRNPDKIITIIPVGHRKIPKTLEEIKICNDTTAIACELHLIDDPLHECHKISKEMKQNVRNIPMTKVLKYISDGNSMFLPYHLTKLIVSTAMNNIDITISNVPGPRETLYYSGYKCHEMIPLFTPGIGPAFIAIYSMAGSFRITIVYDKVLGINPNDLLELFIKEIDYLKEQYENKLIEKCENKSEKRKSD
jgi:NRPS condensation-like uncharacterized protein